MQADDNGQVAVSDVAIGKVTKGPCIPLLALQAGLAEPLDARSQMLLPPNLANTDCSRQRSCSALAPTGLKTAPLHYTMPCTRTAMGC